MPLKICSNVAIAAYGWDVPAVSCTIDARPTASISNYLQRIGRVSRAFPSPPGPREYQTVLLNALREAVRNKLRPLAWMPCGAGKSHVACDMTALATAKGRSVGFLINRRILVDDLAQRLAARGVPASILMAGREDTGHRTKICSIDTIDSRDITLDVDLLFIDEARIALAPNYLKIIDRHRHIPTVLMDATPHRQDGQPMSKLADIIVYGPTHDELIRGGYLVQTRVVAPVMPDLSKCSINSGEFNEQQTAVAMKGLTGDMVKEWLYRGQDRPTIIHCASVAHSKEVTARFMAAGVESVHVDANTPDDERNEVWARLAEGAPSKKDALVIDVAGNWFRHGYVEDERVWNLEKGEAGTGKPCEAALSLRRCPACFAVFRTHIDTCPECGKKKIASTRQIIERKAALEEKQRANKEAKREEFRATATTEQLRAKYAEYAKVGRIKGYKPFWAQMMYKNLTGHFPSKAITG